MTTAHTPGTAPKTPAVTFWCRWEVLMRYSHVVDAKHISPIWFDIDVSALYNFRSTLEDTCSPTSRRLGLATPIITHRVAEMVREASFARQDYTSLTAGIIAFLFDVHTEAAAKKLRTKARIWDNVLRGNIFISMSESSQLLEMDRCDITTVNVWTKH